MFKVLFKFFSGNDKAMPMPKYRVAIYVPWFECRWRDKVCAIKMLRQLTGLGLKQTKLWFDVRQKDLSENKWEYFILPNSVEMNKDEFDLFVLKYPTLSFILIDEDFQEKLS